MSKMASKILLIFAIASFVSQTVVESKSNKWISDCKQISRSVFLTCFKESNKDSIDNNNNNLNAVCRSDRKQDIIRMQINHCQMPDLQSYNFFIVYPNLSEFHISNIELESLKNEDFHGANALNHFIASNNRISEIRSFVFGRAPHVTHVDLYNNRITVISENAFEYVKSTLRVINLSKNAIQYVNRKTFRGLTALTALYLGYNNITYIEPNAFAESNNLTWLDLSSNSIQFLERGCFDGLNNLRSLDLSYNMIKDSDITIHTFSPLVYLNELQLNDNQFRNPEWLDALELNYLMSLNLAHNQIAVVEPHFGKLAIALEKLDLSQNIIELIHLNAFRGMNRLRNLNISYNRLSEIDSDVFQGVANVDKLDLSGNDFRSPKETLKNILIYVRNVIV